MNFQLLSYFIFFDPVLQIILISFHKTKNELNSCFHNLFYSKRVRLRTYKILAAVTPYSSKSDLVLIHRPFFFFFEYLK